MTAPKLQEIVRVCENPDCLYAEFGFRAGSDISLYNDPRQQALLCVVMQDDMEGPDRRECPYWKRSSIRPMPESN